MAKLSLSVNGNNSESRTEEPKPISLSLTKKVQQDQSNDDDTVSSSGLSTHIQQTGDASAEADSIAKWLVNTFGNEVFNELKENPNLQLPYTDKDIDTLQWVGRLLKTYLTQESINSITSKINANNKGAGNSSSDISEDKMAKYNAKFQELKERIENLEGEKAQVQQELNTAIPLSKFVSEIFRDPGNESEPQKELIHNLNEALQNSKENSLSKFMIRFAKGWIYLKTKLDTLGDDEKQNLDNVYDALTKMLEFISECYISERRILLDCIAKHCSTFFATYDFISPEQTLNADPDIHNAGGLGNARIKEGTTFCVIRRDTKKTVKYADIKVVE